MVARVGKIVLGSLGLLLVWGALGARPLAIATPCEFENVERMVAIGDVHGADGRFGQILQAAGIVDRAGRWSAGKTHLVQLGDVLDRGPDSRKAVDRLARLEREASAAGGRVHSLLGNHEVMRMLGDLRYVNPGEYAKFATPDSEEVRRPFIERAPAAERERLVDETPLGMIEMILAFGPKGPYGARLRGLNTVVRINGLVFLHGGISPDVAALPCAAINDSVRRDITTDIEKTRSEPPTRLTTREDGPLWYRGLALEPEAFAPRVDQMLALQHARAFVVAHTVTPTARIVARFGGKVVLIDTGMQPEYVPEGRASALEIRDVVFTAIYVDGREVLGRVPAAAFR